MRYTKNDLGRISEESGKQIKWWYFIPALIWIGIVIQLSVVPGSSLSRYQFFSFKQMDKVVHLVIYLVMALTIMLGLLGFRRLSQSDMLWTIGFCSLVGIALEIAQKTGNANRHFEILDIIANIIGALFGSALFLHFYKKLTDGRN